MDSVIPGYWKQIEKERFLTIKRTVPTSRL